MQALLACFCILDIANPTYPLQLTSVHTTPTLLNNLTKMLWSRLVDIWKGTLNNGLILPPSDDFKIDCYPDADFAGLWLQDDKQDPHCVTSRTRYVIWLENCPVLWKSKLQTEIALSTMEAEYVALSTSCCDLFPLIDITNYRGKVPYVERRYGSSRPSWSS
jgi:hypothetical protein